MKNKPEKLLNEIGLIDDGIIEEAEIFKPKAVRKHYFIAPSAAAACIVVAIAILISKQLNSELPMLTVNMVTGDFGFEGFMAYDISELQRDNPWSLSEDGNIETLPVFRNPTVSESQGRFIKGLSADEMISNAKKTAKLLGLTVDSVFTNPTEENLNREREKERSISGNSNYEPNYIPYEAVAVCGDVTIKAEIDGLIRIFFESGIELPEEYSFTYYNTSEQQAVDALNYLLEKYASVVNMKSPAIDLFGDYDIYSRRSFDYTAYESKGSLKDKILGYNFNWVRFSSNENGSLWIIDRYKADISQKIGDYPIITAQKAQELFLQKRYITTVPEEYTEGMFIASVELIYRAYKYEEIFMPYYRFLAELPGIQEHITRDNGLKTFGAFYVPAVEEKYLDNMPVWDGSFN